MSFALVIQQSWEKTSHWSLFSGKLNQMCQLTFIALLLGITVTLYLEHKSECLVGVEASVESYCLSSAWQSAWGGVSLLFTFQFADSTVHI